jgi:hypothetical protein
MRERLVQEATTEAEYTAPDARRRFGRHRVMLSAKLCSPHGLSTAVLLDLSEGGAMVSAPLPVPKGSHVVLSRGVLDVHGVVLWVDGRRLGIQFDEPVDERIIAETVNAVPRSAH